MYYNSELVSIFVGGSPRCTEHRLLPVLPPQKHSTCVSLFLDFMDCCKQSWNLNCVSLKPQRFSDKVDSGEF